jgi:hypothetical protein
MWVSPALSYTGGGRVGWDATREYLMIIEGQAFLQSYVSDPCVSPVELTDGGGGVGEKPNHTTARKPGPL